MEPISNLRALERAARDARISDVAALAGAHAQQGYTPDARRLRVAGRMEPPSGRSPAGLLGPGLAR